MKAIAQIVSEEKILEMERAEQERFDSMIEQQAVSKQEAWTVKQTWLDIYQMTLSPKLACQRTGVAITTYRRWRSTCAQFARALNQAIVDAQEELVSSAYSQATGYLRANADGEVECDAGGKPIYHGGSPALAAKMLGLDRKEEEKGTGGVTIAIDFGAVCGQGAAARMQAEGTYDHLDGATFSNEENNNDAWERSQQQPVLIEQAKENNQELKGAENDSVHIGSQRGDSNEQ